MYSLYNRSNGKCRRVARLTVLLLLSAWLLCWVAAVAQTTWPPLNGVVADDTGRLNASQVNNAANSLQQLGVKPLAVLVQSSTSFPSDDAFGKAAAAQYNLASGGVVDPNLFAVVVSLGNRRSVILYGDALKPVMRQARSNGTLADQIRMTYLDPNLAAGDFTGAFSDSFTRAAHEIDLYKNPPPTAAPAPPVVNNFDFSGLGKYLLWGWGIIILLGLLVFLGPVLWRQFRRSQEEAVRRRTLQEQLTQARNVAADMITNLDFPPDPHDQIQYKFLALALENERPQQLAQITTVYHQIYQRLSDALALFNSLNQTPHTDEANINAAIAQYQPVQSEVKAADAFLRRLADLGKSVEGQASAAPGETDAAKKAIAAATDALRRLAAAAPDLYAPEPARTLQPASAKLAEAERDLAAKPLLSLRAYDAASAARSYTEGVVASVNSLSPAYNFLAQQRAKLTSARSRGFKLPESDQALATALNALSDAARQLEAGNIAVFANALKQGSDAVQQAGRR